MFYRVSVDLSLLFFSRWDRCYGFLGVQTTRVTWVFLSHHVKDLCLLMLTLLTSLISILGVSTVVAFYLFIWVRWLLVVTQEIFRCVLRTLYKELTHWKRLWCWEGLGAGGEGDDRGWDGWMASWTRWMWVWVNSGSWWWTGRPSVLRFMGSQRVRHDWVTELNWTECSFGIWWLFYKWVTPWLSEIGILAKLM